MFINDDELNKFSIFCECIPLVLFVLALILLFQRRNAEENCLCVSSIGLLKNKLFKMILACCVCVKQKKRKTEGMNK